MSDGAAAVPSDAMSTEMSSGTLMVFVKDLSAENSSSHRSEPAGFTIAGASVVAALVPDAASPVTVFDVNAPLSDEYEIFA